MSVGTVDVVLTTLERRKADIREQIDHLNTLGLICERGGGAFIGGGLGVFFYSFFSGDMSQLGAMLAGSAAPFTLAGFLFIAATNYQQQRQFQIIERQDVDRELREIHDRKIAERLRREQLFVQLLTRYIELRDSLPIIGGLGQLSEMAKGVVAFEYLLQEWRKELGIPQLAAVARGENIDLRKIEGRLPLNNVKRQLAPLVQLFGVFVERVTKADVDEQEHMRAYVKARLTDPEIDILSIVQSASSTETNPTLRGWLDGSRS